jgi:NAD(P)-dependent dehydrogenase (short-subunit alcohol dehydrogenase family)
MSADDAEWRLDDRVALVTGGGRGLGRACAVKLARAGATVMVVARTEGELTDCVAEITAAGGAAFHRVADVSDEDQVRDVVRAASELGDLRVCLTAAGTNRTGPTREYQTADWDLLFAINVRALFMVCRAVGDHMISRGMPGSIVNMSSQMGAVGYPGRAAYCATKHAVDGFTKALAVEWAPLKVRVNAVAPTFVETPMTRPMLANPEFRADVLARLPTKELATQSDVANAVRYLACDASASVVGHVLRVDGGWTAW